MAVMMLMLINFNNGCVHYSTNIFWLPRFISLRLWPHLFSQLSCFCVDFVSLCILCAALGFVFTHISSYLLT